MGKIRYELRYSEHARKDLFSCERTFAKRIVKKLAENCALPDPLQRAKALTGELSGVYRYRIGNYRVLFELNGSNEIIVLMVLRIRHRKEVYRI